MTKKRFILITMLTITICVMSLGYAALQEKIDITGGASVDSLYRVEITKVEKTATAGSATEKDVPSYTGLNANFNVGLTKTNDSITYNITISNLGTVDVKLNNTTVTTEGSDKVSVLKTGINNGDILLAGESKVLTVKIKYIGETTEEIIASTKLIFNYTRLKGGTGQVTPEPYLAYLRGDQITFAGSNWYVIEDSPTEQDYVTVLKEKILTNEELGEYAANETIICTIDNVTNKEYSCTTEGETVTNKRDTMAYYWSDTCHYLGYYGHTDDNASGCSGHNDYENSKIKEFLEGTYINTLGEANLKAINGYKVRLLKTKEISPELNAENAQTSPVRITDLDVPNWIYSNFVQVQTTTWYYWTMSTVDPANTAVDADQSRVWTIYNGDELHSRSVRNKGGVRPVINLLKSSI